MTTNRSLFPAVDHRPSPSPPRSRGKFGLATLTLALILAGCGRPPQLGEDKEVFKAVDALYTAIGLRDTAQVDRCATDLKARREAGTLPVSAADSLESIITEAKGGGWEAAQVRLSTFMEGQTR